MEIRPFKAFRFNEEKVGDVGACISPPYDIISTEQQEQLYTRSEYNIVRIIRGKTEASDNHSSNKYTRAAEYLNSWIEKGVLKQDSTESIYGYVQDFDMFGSSFRRLSFIALARLEEFGDVVRPHEQTLTKPKIDRLNLQKATSTTFGLVFMLYEDQDNVADKIIEKSAAARALIDFVDDGQVRHRLFAITDKNDIDSIAEMMGEKSCIIADGHHRYETALNYLHETADPAARYQMLAFSNMRHEGLIVLATHRLVNNLENFDFAKLLAALEDNFETTGYRFESPASKIEARRKMLARMKAEFESDRNAFGIYAAGDSFHVAVLKNPAVMESLVGEKSWAWKSLDVTVLHKLILEMLLGIDEAALAGGACVEYVKDTDTAIDESIGKVDGGVRQAAFFMNPPKMELLRQVTDAGEKMPQKSTYFYPKIFTGLTIYKL